MLLFGKRSVVYDTANIFLSTKVCPIGFVPSFSNTTLATEWAYAELALVAKSAASMMYLAFIVFPCLVVFLGGNPRY